MVMESTKKAEKRELYDLQLDPGEKHNILANHPDVEKSLLRQLIQIVTSGSTREIPTAGNDTPPWADLVWLPR